MPTTPELNPEHHQRLFAITERIRSAAHDSVSLTTEDYRRLFNELAGGINDSMENGLREALIIFGESSSDKTTLENANTIVLNLESWNNFLQFEAEIFRKCGVSEELSYELIESISGLREKLKIEDLNSEEAISAVESLSESLRTAANDINNFLENEEGLFKVKKFAIGASGVLMMVVNGAGTVAAAVTGGAAFPLMLVSTTVGSLVIKSRDLFLNPRDRRP